MTDLHTLSSLPDDIQDAAFDAFKRMYVKAFPLPDEQEDPDHWRQPPGPDRPPPAVILAGTGYETVERLEVAGGIVVEYYPKSRCGLLAYLVVDPKRRRRGIGRRLVHSAIDHLGRTLYRSQPAQGEQSVRQLLGACCGIVSDHFDYVRMSLAEMQDTLAPDSSAGS